MAGDFTGDGLPDVISNSGGNDYTGGTTISQGSVGLSVDTVGTGGGVTSGPLGTGTLVIASTGGNTAALFASGGPRTLGNQIRRPPSWSPS